MSPKKSETKTESGEEQEVYYVGVSEPLEVRRTILETSKGIIQAMHRYEKYREYRDQKQELMKKVSKQMTELGTLINTFKSSLPKSTVRVKKAREEVQAQRKVSDVKVAQSEVVKAEPVQQPKIVKMTPKKELTELEKLELELSTIESKLSSLTK